MSIVVVTESETLVNVGVASVVERNDPRRWFVSTSGSDSNDGKTPNSPFATLAKAISVVSAKDEILLRCGDTWREQMNAPTLDDVTVASYGYGPKPVIDCSDQITIGSNGWTETYDNDAETWYASKNLSSDATLYGYDSASNLGKIHVGVYENGSQLTQTDTAIESAGSFHVATTGNPNYTPNGTITVVIGSTTQPSLSSSSLSIAVRPYGIKLRDNCTVRGIRTMRNAHDDGSIVLGLNARIEDCDCDDGSKHNCYVESGYLRRVRCSIANKRGVSTESGMLAGTMFVAFRTDPSSLSVTYDECSVYGGSSFTNGLFGFYFHGAPNSYGTVILKNCSVESVDYGAGGDYKNLLMTGCRLWNTKSMIFGGDNSAGTKTVLESCILNTGIVTGDRVIESKTKTTTMLGCEIVANWAGSAYMIDTGAGPTVTYEFKNCTFLQKPGSTSQLGIIKVRDGQRLNMTGCCLFQSDEATTNPDDAVTPIVVVDTGGTYLAATSNNNLYHAGYKADTTSPRRVRFERLGSTFICETSGGGPNGESRWVNESGGALGTFDGSTSSGPVLPYSTRAPGDTGANPTVPFRGMSDAQIPTIATWLMYPKSSWVELGSPAKRYGPVARTTTRQFYLLEFDVRP